MPKYSYKGMQPKLSAGVFIAESADLIGDVICDENSNIWFQCVVRADVNKIHIGKNTNVQDSSMLHVTEKNALVIGDNVSIGHSVTLHGCTIENSCLSGMGATILDGAIIGENSVVAGGSVVPPGKVYPPKSMIMGNPAVVKRELTEAEAHRYANHYKRYVGYKDEYLDSTIVKKLK